MSGFRQILPKFNSAGRQDKVYEITQNLIRQEAKIGGNLLQPIPAGHDRQFFCMDSHTWVWHEAWSDKAGQHIISTRYEVRPDGIFKVQNGGSYQSLSQTETKNLVKTIKLYTERMINGYQAELQPAN